MTKKAQGALEYLMTYGWAVLILVIVGAALFASGAFNPSAFTGKKSVGFQDLTLKDFKVSGTTASLVIGPSRDESINITAGSATCEGSTGSTFTPTGKIRPGSVVTTTVAGFTSLTAGDPYTCNLTLSYTDLGTSLTHTSAGKLMGKAE